MELRELYFIINLSSNNKPTLQTYFEKKFDLKELDFRFIYTLPRIVTTNTYFSPHQYKLLNNILYINKKLVFGLVFELSTTLFCSFCKSFGENIAHLSCDCTTTQCLWKKLRLKLNDNIIIFPLTLQTAIFSFLEADCQFNLIQNHILLISKLSTYKSR